MPDTAEQPHALEIEFGLPAREMLDIINRRNRRKIAVRGAIAEAHLLRLLREYKAAGAIDQFEDYDIDGYPDVRVDVGGKSSLIECKNVQKEALPLEQKPITVDFWRTRAPVGHPNLRYYAPDEFDILAACLWNRTGRWEFLFIATQNLPRQPQHLDRLTNRVVVGEPPGRWTDDLPGLLRTIEPLALTARARAAQTGTSTPPGTPG